MPRPVGGRGHKASYQTIVMRVPLNLRPQIDEIVDRFYEDNMNLEEVQKIETTEDRPKDIEQRHSDLKEIIERYKVNSKASRDWVQFNKLIDELEQEINN